MRKKKPSRKLVIETSNTKSKQYKDITKEVQIKLGIECETKLTKDIVSITRVKVVDTSNENTVFYSEPIGSHDITEIMSVLKGAR